jgi:hypothetical protein
VALCEQPTPATLYMLATCLVSWLLFLLLPKLPIDEWLSWVLWGVPTLTTAIAAYRLHGRAERGRLARVVVTRPVEPVRADMSTPYRGRLRRLARKVAPPVSGSLAALVALLSFGLIAGVVPTVLTLPRWIEWQIVVAGWWLVWAGIFSALLYRGWRVASDMPPMSQLKEPPSLPSMARGCSDPGCSDPEGCVAALVMLVAFAIAFSLAWLLVEMVVPFVFAGAYWIVVRALARVANDTHACEGKLGVALLWGGVWALLYTAPIALLIMAGHWLMHRGM